MADAANPPSAPADAPASSTNGTAAAAAPARKMSEQLADLRSRLPETTRHWADDAEVLIREHPLKTVAGVFVGGLIVGYLLRGRR